MVLFSAAGWAISHFAGIRVALTVGVLAGFIVANLVPAESACAIPGAPKEQDRDAGQEGGSPRV